MFINTNPRIVLNGSDTFMSTQEAESLHQRLVEMTNNNINAWSVFRSVSAPVDSWFDQDNGFNNNENITSTTHNGYFQEQYSSEPQAINFPKATTFSAAAQNNKQSRSRSSDTHQDHQSQMQVMSFVDTQSPMLGTDYTRWSMMRGRGSFAEFSKGNTRESSLQYHHLQDESNVTSYNKYTSPENSQAPYMMPLTAASSVSTTNPSTVFGTYSNRNVSINPNALQPFAMSPQHPDICDNGWWPTETRSGLDLSFGAAAMHDGLPRYQNTQRQNFDNTWSPRTGACNAQGTITDTVSPKELALDTFPASMSSSGSSQGSLAYFSDSSTLSSFNSNPADCSGPQKIAITQEPVTTRRHRQMLPAARPEPPKGASMLPHHHAPGEEKTEKKVDKQVWKAKRISSPRTRTHTAQRNIIPALSAATDTQAPKVPDKHKDQIVISPKPASSGRKPPQPATVQAENQRNAKDDFLVKSKLAGMSYKEIRRKGKFTEAESTLRGRYRTLTKHKAARVRKPEWEDQDIKLLKKAVRKLSRGSDGSKSRLPWKEVAEYIANNGGSYHFGNATCRKRWDELQADHAS